MKPHRSILIGLTIALFVLGAALTMSRPGGQIAPPVSVQVNAITPSLSRDSAIGLASSGNAPAAERRPLPDPPPENRRADRGPVLLAGRVTDDLGQAIDPMRVIATPLVYTDLPPRGGSKEEQAEIDAEARRRRAQDTSAAVHYLADGSFEVRGWTSAMRFNLRAEGNHRSISREYPRGTLDAKIEFKPVGKVHALLLHDRS